ncbi:MAG: VWA domain-containing protein [Gemmatimonadota bacterium]|nr:VWA domain-containing protein [Gemmatimonadota bacterium]
MRASLAVAMLTVPAALAAQGRIIPVCPMPRGDGPELMIACPTPDVVRASGDVRARLDGRVIRYEVTERFLNRGGRLGEADYLFPLPAGAAFRDLKLSINGQLVTGETMDANQARGVYEEIVRRLRDPALVEWMGSGMLRARIFPIQPGETKTVVVSYEAVVPREGDALRVDYSMGPAVRPAAADYGGRSAFTLRYSDDEPLGVPYSPTNALDTRDSSGTTIVRVLDGGGDVTLLLPLRQTGRAALSVLTHATRDDSGFAMITMSPPAEHAAPSPRDVTFVLDVSGSMSGQKIEQARAAGRALLATLRPQDRFRLIDFSSDVRDFRDDFAYATRDNVRSALRYLDGLQAGGGTNIAGALDEALRGRPRDDGRLPLVLFITDGMPTIGERDPNAIAAEASRERGDARVFTFGLGADVNASLLEQLALEGRGTAQFVRPDENVERAVGIVAQRLVDPVATDLRVRVEGGGVQLRDVVPALPADLFAGQDLVVMARYTGSGSGRVVVEGRQRGHAVRWTTDASLGRDARGNRFIPRLWAAQRIGYLSAEQRKNGGSPELDDEIRTLGERYGIPTEFTSYLVQEPRYAVDAVGGVRRGAMPASVQLNGVVVTGVAGGVAAANAPVAQFEAAKLAASQRQLKTTAALDSLTAAVPSLGGGATRTANGHTFTLRDGRWVDGRLTDSTRVVQVQLYSKAYFTLLDRIPELRAMAALGDRVVMVGRKVAIEVVAQAPELTDSALADLVRSW